MSANELPSLTSLAEFRLKALARSDLSSHVSERTIKGLEVLIGIVVRLLKDGQKPKLPSENVRQKALGKVKAQAEKLLAALYELDKPGIDVWPAFVKTMRSANGDPGQRLQLAVMEAATAAELLQAHHKSLVRISPPESAYFSRVLVRHIAHEVSRDGLTSLDRDGYLRVRRSATGPFAKVCAICFEAAGVSGSVDHAIRSFQAHQAVQRAKPKRARSSAGVVGNGAKSTARSHT